MQKLPRTRLVGLVVMFLALPALAGVAGAQPADPRPPRGPQDRQPGATLTVSGEGEASAAPDLATLRLGATVQADEATAAQEQVNEIMQRALEAVKGLDVPEERIQTADLSLYPVYSEGRPRPGQQGAEAEEPRIVGYRASNTLRIELEDLEKIGDVIDSAVGAGANQLQGVEFGLRRDMPARSDAMRQATRIARAKADVLAEAAGVRLGQLVEVREGSVDVFYPQAVMGARMAMEASTPVEPGQVRVTARVTLVYRISPQRDRPTTRDDGGEE